MSVKTSRDSLKMTNSALSVSMELDPDVKDKSRPFPSISDYYVARAGRTDQPIQLQSGLSNYSGLKLGDDRIAVNESILSESYRLPVEDKMLIASPSRHKTVHSRKRDYEDAVKKVGEVEIDRLERVMKDKLFQRSYATSSPFQVRKAFKFFDRENSMRISIEGFTSALEFLGFQFSDLQNLALFSRYDPQASGTIDFMYFINNAMFYAAVEAPPRAASGIPSRPSSRELLRVPDIEDDEVIRLQRVEIRRIFDKIDTSRSGKIDCDQFELLLMAVGYNVTGKELEACLRDIGVKSGEFVKFETFFEWWTSNMGASYLRRK